MKFMGIWKFTIQFVFFCLFLKKGLEFARAKPFAFGASAFGLPHSSLGPKEMTTEMTDHVDHVCPHVGV